jgi:glucuronosyltransferase
MHGGLLGIQEAIYHGVPLILLPIFAEQDYNAARVHNRGHGIKLEITTLTTGVLTTAIRELLENRSYKERMLGVSKVFHDRFMGVRPIDTAVWWTEFVLRHGGDTSFLKPKGIHQTWYQRRLLDVWGFIFVVLMLSIVVLWKVLKFGVGRLRKTTASKKVKEN